MKLLFSLALICPILIFSQDLANDWSQIDPEVLNHFITIEVNKLRKKAKQDPLINEPALTSAAKDHSDYLAKNQLLSHFQKAKEKANPGNRVQYYGRASYSQLVENAQFFNKNTTPKFKGEKKESTITEYERLAKEIVLNWKNSKHHYENMISPDYKSIKIAQSLVINLLLKDSISQSQFEELPIPMDTKFDEIRYNKLLFLLELDSANESALGQCIFQLDTIPYDE